MELGFFTMPIHPPSRNFTETLQEDRELVLLADELLRRGGAMVAWLDEGIPD